MKRRFTVAAMVLVAVVAAAQLIRPGIANPPVDLTRTIQAHVSTTGLGVVSWIAPAARAIRTQPSGRGTRKWPPCPGLWRTA